MLFAVDIDNTIARDIKNAALKRYVARELGLPADEYTARALLETVSQDRIDAVFAAAKASPDVMAALQPIAGAQDALHKLASYGNVVYVSCRVQTLHDTTIEWLTTYHFPSPTNVFLCDSYYAKYLHAYHAAVSGEPIALIDDNAEKIVLSFRHVASQYPDIAMQLIPRLLVVAFVPKEVRWRMAPPPFPVLILKSWENEHLTRLLKVEIQGETTEVIPPHH